MDSTTLKAWSNGGKSRKSDPQAGWSVKKGTQGVDEFVYGYKLHLMVDTEYELPIAANVTPGNVHDAKKAPSLLREARVADGRFKPNYVIADKGYSGSALISLIRGQYHAKPIINIPAGHKRLKQRFGETQKTPVWMALYKQRSAVERVFSRLKCQRSLNNIAVRGRMKVQVHAFLGLIAMQTWELAKKPR